jgi:gas vesicle protein
MTDACDFTEANMTEARTTRRSDGRTGAVILGVLCGAAVGAVLGVIFAPMAGADLRQQVADSAGRVRRQASDAYGSASDALHNVVARSRQAIEAGQAAFQKTRGNGAAHDVRMS